MSVEQHFFLTGVRLCIRKRQMNSICTISHDTDAKVGDVWRLPFTIRFFSSEPCLTKLVSILRSGWSRSTRRGDSVFGSFFTTEPMTAPKPPPWGFVKAWHCKFCPINSSQWIKMPMDPEVEIIYKRAYWKITLIHTWIFQGGVEYMISSWKFIIYSPKNMFFWFGYISGPSKRPGCFEDLYKHPCVITTASGPYLHWRVLADP